MPELPEVETTVRGLAPVLEGRRIVSVELRRGDLRRPFPAGLAEQLTGARVTKVRRRAKYGLIDTDRGDTFIFHLGMSGSWRLDQKQPGPHDHVILTTDAGRSLSLNDPRRFGSIDLVPTERLDAEPPFAGMGPEPLSDAFDGAWLKRKLAGRGASIKSLLLDQRIVAGLGNIYACEALFLAGIAPGAKAGTLSQPRLDRLTARVRQVLKEAIAAGGSTLRNYVQPGGELGYFAAQCRVYGREGLPCTACDAPIRRRATGGRSTFYCPNCQRR